MNKICPICSSILLRHLHQHEITWFCPKCRQEMPNLDVSPVTTKGRSFLQQKSYQHQQPLVRMQPKVQIAAKKSMIIDSSLDEGRRRLDVVSFILSQNNSLTVKINAATEIRTFQTEINQEKLFLANFFQKSEVIILYICQAILTRDISLLSDRLCQKFKPNYTELELPVESLVYWLYGIKILVMDFISSMAKDIYDSFSQRNQYYLALEIASYFDVAIASMIELDP